MVALSNRLHAWVMVYHVLCLSFCARHWQIIAVFHSCRRLSGIVVKFSVVDARLVNYTLPAWYS